MLIDKYRKSITGQFEFRSPSPLIKEKKKKKKKKKKRNAVCLGTQGLRLLTISFKQHGLPIPLIVFFETVLGREYTNRVSCSVLC